MSVPDIDLQLLRCLEVLVSERHVTRAAVKMGMSQSGMSTALAKLRRVFNDPILVRTSRGMAPSEKAPEIAGAVHRALLEITNAIEGPNGFDAATDGTNFRIMASDYVGVVILPHLMRMLSENAPGILLTVIAPQPSRIRESLANSEVDLVVGFFHDIADALMQTIVCNENLACVVRKDHPVIKRSLSLDTYAAGTHVYYGSPPSFISSIEVIIDRTLRSIGIDRTIGVHLPLFSLMPRIVEQTDMVATLPTRLAQSFAERAALRVFPAPFKAVQLPVRAIWHERMHTSSAHKWLRRTLQEVGQKLEMEKCFVAEPLSS